MSSDSFGAFVGFVKEFFGSGEERDYEHEGETEGVILEARKKEQEQKDRQTEVAILEALPADSEIDRYTLEDSVIRSTRSFTKDYKLPARFTRNLSQYFAPSHSASHSYKLPGGFSRVLNRLVKEGAVSSLAHLPLTIEPSTGFKDSLIDSIFGVADDMRAIYSATYSRGANYSGHLNEAHKKFEPPGPKVCYFH